MLPEDCLPVLDHEAQLVVDIKDVFLGVWVKDSTSGRTALIFDVGEDVFAGLTSPAIQSVGRELISRIFHSRRNFLRSLLDPVDDLVDFGDFVAASAFIGVVVKKSFVERLSVIVLFLAVDVCIHGGLYVLWEFV